MCAFKFHKILVNDTYKIAAICFYKNVQFGAFCL